MVAHTSGIPGMHQCVQSRVPEAVGAACDTSPPPRRSNGMMSSLSSACMPSRLLRTDSSRGSTAFIKPWVGAQAIVLPLPRCNLAS
eukprot:scaffold143396_cov136-Phaeocystis_antarctica.AAC.2